MFFMLSSSRSEAKQWACATDKVPICSVWCSLMVLWLEYKNNRKQWGVGRQNSLLSKLFDLHSVWKIKVNLEKVSPCEIGLVSEQMSGNLYHVELKMACCDTTIFQCYNTIKKKSQSGRSPVHDANFNSHYKIQILLTSWSYNEGKQPPHHQLPVCITDDGDDDDDDKSNLQAVRKVQYQWE